MKPVFSAAETTGATAAGTGGGPGFLAAGRAGQLGLGAGSNLAAVQGSMIPGTQTFERSLYAARPELVTSPSTSFADRISNLGNIFDADKLQASFIDTTIKEQVPGAITDALPNILTERSPLTVAGLGLGLKMAATPPPPWIVTGKLA